MDKVLSPELVESFADAVAPLDPGPERSERIRAKVFARVKTDGSPAFATVAEADGAWEETSPGNWVKPLRADGETISILVRLEPGAVFPAHSHPVDEETFVLEGETRFGDIELRSGDYHFAPQGSKHGQVTTTAGCLLFIRTGTGATSGDPD